MVDIASISEGLERRSDGIWYGRVGEAISYPTEGNEILHALEDGSFWFTHRNACIQAVVAAHPPAGGGAIFDIGGGNGFVSMGLASAGFEVVLVEPGPVGARNARARGLEHVICATTHAARFKPGSLPAVGLFDVLEHLEDDRAFLDHVRSMLHEDGRVYITVPAYGWLWSEEDVSAGHFRRYTRRGLVDVIEGAGLEVLFSSYFFGFLPLPILLLRALPYRLGLARRSDLASQARRDHSAGSGWLSRVVGGLLRPEVGRLRRSQSLGFGGSCIVVAKVAGRPQR